MPADTFPAADLAELVELYKHELGLVTPHPERRWSSIAGNLEGLVDLATAIGLLDGSIRPQDLDPEQGVALMLAIWRDEARDNARYYALDPERVAPHERRVDVLSRAIDCLKRMEGSRNAS